MTMNFWLRLRWLFQIWFLLAATTFIPPSAFAYDGQNQTAVAYNSSGESSMGYNAVSVLTREKKSGPARDCVLFAKFAGFLAAKTAETVAADAAAAGSRGPSFIAAADGSVFPVPRGATGPLPTRAPGMQFTGGSGGYEQAASNKI